MDTRVVAALIIIAVALLIGFAIWAYQRRRTGNLRRQFGPGYDRTLRETGSRRRAEAELEARLRRVRALHIRELDLKDRARLVGAWQRIQARFADDPQGAVAAADRLVAETMDAQGYPGGGLDQCAADLSVDHAHVVDGYLTGREITSHADRGQASTEDLRQALISYRAVVEALLGEPLGRREASDGRAA